MYQKIAILFFLLLLPQISQARRYRGCNLAINIGNHNFYVHLAKRIVKKRLDGICHFDKKLLTFETKYKTFGKDRCDVKKLKYAGKSLVAGLILKKIALATAGITVLSAGLAAGLGPFIFMDLEAAAIGSFVTLPFGGFVTAGGIKTLLAMRGFENEQYLMERFLAKEYGKENCSYSALNSIKYIRYKNDPTFMSNLIEGVAYTGRDGFINVKDKVCRQFPPTIFGYKVAQKNFNTQMDRDLDPALDELIGKWMLIGSTSKNKTLYHPRGISSTYHLDNYRRFCTIPDKKISKFAIIKEIFHSESDSTPQTRHIKIEKNEDDYYSRTYRKEIFAKPTNLPDWTGVQLEKDMICRFTNANRDQLICAKGENVSVADSYYLFVKF